MDLGLDPFKHMPIEELHGIMNDMEKEVGPNPASKCGKRTPCDGCCYMNVKVLREEAQRLLPYLPSDKGVDYLKEVTTRDDLDRMKQKRPCVFLQDHRCTVYNIRPSICRAYYVRSSPKYCHQGIKGFTKVQHGMSPGVLDLFARWWKAHPEQKPKLMEEHLLDLLLSQKDGEGRDPVKEVAEGRRE